jgi:hypothetical protein
MGKADIFLETDRLRESPSGKGVFCLIQLLPSYPIKGYTFLRSRARFPSLLGFFSTKASRIA